MELTIVSSALAVQEQDYNNPLNFIALLQLVQRLKTLGGGRAAEGPDKG